MTRIVLATCRHLPELTTSDALLAAALRERGSQVVAAPWDTIDPARPGGLVCLRSTWDYFRRWPEFRGWVAGFARAPGTLVNPPATVFWNTDKRYLRELGEAGIALPRTVWTEPGERPDVDAFLREPGGDRAVIKPRISGAAWGTHLLRPGQRLEDNEWPLLETAGALVQAFVPEIATGEISLVYIEGNFSHAVRKVAAPGDFRVQSDFGGTVEPFAPDAAVMRFGDRVLAATPEAWLYARIDLVITSQGPLLMELEIIEPDLFLAFGRNAPGCLAEALIARCGAERNLEQPIA